MYLEAIPGKGYTNAGSLGETQALVHPQAHNRFRKVLESVCTDIGMQRPISFYNKLVDIHITIYDICDSESISLGTCANLRPISSSLCILVGFPMSLGSTVVNVLRP